MKKFSSLSIVLILLILTTGCNSSRDTPINQPEKNGNNSNASESPDETAKDSKYSIEDYFPILSNTEYVYEGQGNEYASYHTYVDYFDTKTNRMQIRTHCSGTDVAEVLENKDGKLTVIYSRGEAYYRDNKLSTKASKEETEILLMEPLVKGTQWTISDQRKRSITNLDVKITTPSGDYRALEVTTKGPNDLIKKDYYAPEIGLVKSVFLSDENEIISTLSEIRKDVPLTTSILFFYPDQDQKMYTHTKDVSYITNDVTRIVLQKEMSQVPPKESYLPLISKKTKINYMYLGKDRIAYIDFSKDFIKDMNAGAYYESLILQSIVNTIGTYYGVEKVYLTIDAKPYESGHLLFEKGELMEVNLDDTL